ncbi:hypothetical protein BDZ88DRAFT_480013 [Geranomyces variabilis]|nr:hypothetical protein BDZ88DRAFT_480013 [Geranomyces variabilis]
MTLTRFRKLYSMETARLTSVAESVTLETELDAQVPEREYGASEFCESVVRGRSTSCRLKAFELRLKLPATAKHRLETNGLLVLSNAGMGKKDAKHAFISCHWIKRENVSAKLQSEEMSITSNSNSNAGFEEIPFKSHSSLANTLTVGGRHGNLEVFGIGSGRTPPAAGDLRKERFRKEIHAGQLRGALSKKRRDFRARGHSAVGFALAAGQLKRCCGTEDVAVRCRGWMASNALHEPALSRYPRHWHYHKYA